MHFEKLKLHWNNPTEWIVSEDGEVLFILDKTETEADEETVALPEGGAPFAEAENLSITSEERLKIKLPEELLKKTSSAMT